MTILLAILIALNIATLVAGVSLYRRSRTVESDREAAEATAVYAARHMLEMEARERWRALDTDALHPLNREEVVRLLARVDEASSGALSTQEREFLDRLVESERRVLRRAAGRPFGEAPTPSGA